MEARRRAELERWTPELRDEAKTLAMPATRRRAQAFRPRSRASIESRAIRNATSSAIRSKRSSTSESSRR